MGYRTCLKMAFPTIMNQYSTFKTICKIIIDGSGTTILRKCDKCGQFALPCPKPAIFTVYLGTGFVRTYNMSGLNFITNEPVCRCCLLGKTFKNFTNSALAAGEVANIAKIS